MYKVTVEDLSGEAETRETVVTAFLWVGHNKEKDTVAQHITFDGPALKEHSEAPVDMLNTMGEAWVGAFMEFFEDISAEDGTSVREFLDRVIGFYDLEQSIKEENEGGD